MDANQLENTSHRVAGIAGQASDAAGRIAGMATRVADRAPQMMDNVSKAANRVAGRLSHAAGALPDVMDQAPEVASRVSGEVSTFVHENRRASMMAAGLLGLLTIFFLVFVIRASRFGVEHGSLRPHRRRAAKSDV